MPDYRNMTATEALRHAKDVSGLTAEEIAEAIGTSPAVIRRYLQRDDGYTPCLDRLPGLCRAMHNTVMLQWVEAQLEREPDDVPYAQSRAEVLTAVSRVAACLGDVHRRLAESESRGIDPACARDVRSLLGDVIEDCRVVRAMIQHVAACADITECAPLASVRDECGTKKCWWRFWG